MEIEKEVPPGVTPGGGCEKQRKGASVGAADWRMWRVQGRGKGNRELRKKLVSSLAGNWEAKFQKAKPVPKSET